jgi:hypothetical protein
MYIRPPDAARPFLLGLQFLGGPLCHVASRTFTIPSGFTRTVKDSAVVAIGDDRRGAGSDNGCRRRLLAGPTTLALRATRA